MSDEALEKFQKKRARADFEFFKPHLEAAREYLIAHREKVHKVREELEAAKGRGTELVK